MRQIERLPPLVQRFLHHVSVVFVFKALSLALTLIVYVLCVRELGAAAWGQVALITSVAGVLLIPLTFGLYNGVVKYVPVSNESESRAIMGTALAGNLVISTLAAGLLALAGQAVERATGFPFSHWLWAVALAMSINLYILAESFLRGQQKFYLVGSYKFYASIILLLGTAAILYAWQIKSMMAYLLPFILYHLLFFAAALPKSGLWPLRVTGHAWWLLLGFGLFNMLTWLCSTVLFTSDLYLVALYGTGHETGVYSIYQNNIRALCTILFHDVFAVVFLPMIASLDKRQVDRIAVKYAIPIYLAIGAGVGMLTAVLVLLLGKSVPLDAGYIAMTAAGTAMNMMYLLFTSILSLDGIRAAKLAFLSLLIPMPLLLGVQFVFVQQWGITGGMVSVIVVNTLLVISCRLAIHYFHPEKHTAIGASPLPETHVQPGS
jgi:O-antigen/teichoic acid export membrane protein